jgi:hypothetical protein
MGVHYTAAGWITAFMARMASLAAGVVVRLIERSRAISPCSLRCAGAGPHAAPAVAGDRRPFHCGARAHGHGMTVVVGSLASISVMLSANAYTRSGSSGGARNISPRCRGLAFDTLRAPPFSLDL